MRALLAVQIIAAAGLVAGCSTYQPADTGAAYGAGYDNTYTESHPQPTASPSQRPGLNPDDPRDPQFNSRPNPTQTPPSSKP
jgi:hypothetical protein